MQIRINTEAIAVTKGDNLMDVLVRNNQDVSNVCNGQGTCGKCKVQIICVIPAPSEIEYQKLTAAELAAGIRLACQVKPCAGMAVSCKSAESTARKGELLFLPQQADSQDAGLRQLQVSVKRPTLADERGDWDRLAHKIQELCQLDQVKIDVQQLRDLPATLRQQDFTVTVILWNNQVLAIQPGAMAKPLCGIAIDIGTTNIAVALYNLENGEQLGLVAAGNGQAALGG